MVITTPLCERCGGETGCTKLEIYVLRGHVCPLCRTEDEIHNLSVEVCLSAEYEVARILQTRCLWPDGSPDPKLAQAMAERDFHLSKSSAGH